MLTNRKLSKMQGFTLIELVMVIVVLGILAAAALPRFSNLTTQAKVAANQGVAGAIGAAVNIAHASWVAGGSVSPVDLDGHSITVNVNGWPDGGANSIIAVTDVQCQALFTGLTSILSNGPNVVIAPTTCASGSNNCYQATAAGTVCTLTQPSPNANTITYNIATGAVATP